MHKRVLTGIFLILFLFVHSVTYAQSDTIAYEEGVRLYWTYQIAESITQFDMAIAEDETFAEAYAYRGLAYTRLSNFEPAQADFDRAIELAPDSALVYALRARFSMTQSIANGFSDVETALTLEPDFAIALYMRGVVNLADGDYLDALNDFDATLESNVGVPDFAYTQFLTTVYVGRGLAHEGRERYEEAIAEYDLALAFGLDEPILYYYRGLAYQKAGEMTNALNDFNTALDRDPNYAPVLEALTKFYDERNSVSTALEYNLRWTEAESQNSEAFSYLAHLYVQLDQIRNAYNAATTAIELDSSNSMAWNNRGYTNELLGNPQQALLDYVASRNADITNSFAWNNGGRILSQEYAIQLRDIDNPNIPWVANQDNGAYSMNRQGLYESETFCGRLTQSVLFASANAYSAFFGSDSELRLVQNVLFFADSETASDELNRLKDHLSCLSRRSGGLVGGRSQGINNSVSINYADEGFYAYIEDYSMGGLNLSLVGQFIYFRVFNIVITLGLVGSGDLVLDSALAEADTILGFGQLAVSKLSSAPLILP